MNKKTKVGVLMILLSVLILAVEPHHAKSADEVTKLKVALNTPTTHPNYKYYVRYFDNLVNRSKGQLELKYYWGAALLKGPEITQGIGTGTVDMGEIQSNWDAKLDRTLNCAMVPFLFDDHDHYLRVVKSGLFDYYAKVYAKQNVKLLCLTSSGAQNWWSRTKFFKKPEDFKGVDIRGLGGYSSEGLKIFGANVISLSTYEVITALQRGMVDAVGTAAPSLPTYGWEKHLHYGTFSDWGETPRGFGINMDIWNRLPRNIQTVFMDAANEFMDDHIAALSRDDYQVYFDDWIKKGYYGYKLTRAEKEGFKKALAPLYQKMEKEYGETAKWMLDVVAKNRKQ